ncbi:MAG: hypothetical protein ACTSU9_02115 [Promethearchaeota archaeon]
MKTRGWSCSNGFRCIPREQVKRSPPARAHLIKDIKKATTL